MCVFTSLNCTYQKSHVVFNELIIHFWTVGPLASPFTLNSHHDRLPNGLASDPRGLGRQFALIRSSATRSVAKAVCFNGYEKGVGRTRIQSFLRGCNVEDPSGPLLGPFRLHAIIDSVTQKLGPVRTRKNTAVRPLILFNG